MIFVSVDKSPTFVLKPASHQTVQMRDGQYDRVHIPGIRIRFHGLNEGFHTSLLPVKQNDEGQRLARGILDTKTEAERLGLDEKDLIKRLKTHREYRRAFVDVPTQTDEEVIEVESDERFIHPTGDGGYSCELCEGMHLKNGAGLYRHRQSRRHRDRLDGRVQADLDAINA